MLRVENMFGLEEVKMTTWSLLMVIAGAVTLSAEILSFAESLGRPRSRRA